MAFFLQVNSDVIFHKRDRYGTLTPYRVDKLHVGKLIYTKAISSAAPDDVTYTYKYPEGNTHTHIHTPNKQPVTDSQNDLDERSGVLSWLVLAGSPQDIATMARAEEFGCERDHSEVSESPIVVAISAEEVTQLSAAASCTHTKFFTLISRDDVLFQ